MTFAVHTLTFLEAAPIAGAAVLYIVAAALRDHRRREEEQHTEWASPSDTGDET